MGSKDNDAGDGQRQGFGEHDMVQAMGVLNDEIENVLTEVLKCEICLELPMGKQVRICEEGHHFCFTCHNKMKNCGICRGSLLESRNFAVEKLVTNLGPLLGIQNSVLPPAEPPVNLVRGSFPCPYGCKCKMPAFQMLPHLRAKHEGYLIEKVRSNPFWQDFSLVYNIRFVQDEGHLFSAFVADMGLFTVELTFSGLDFFGCVRVLGDESTADMFEHQLVMRIPRRNLNAYFDFSLTDCPVSSFEDDEKLVRSRGRGLCIKGEHLLEHIETGSGVVIFFSVWKKSKKKTTLPTALTLSSKRHLYFTSDRKVRRNKNRNLRRKRLKVARRSVSEMSESFSRIAL